MRNTSSPRSTKARAVGRACSPRSRPDFANVRAMHDADMPFADAFPPADEAQWRKLVDGVLKGKSFETLVSKTYDDIPLAALYPPAREEAPRALRAALGPWSVIQRIDNPDPIEANKQALT